LQGLQGKAGADTRGGADAGTTEGGNSHCMFGLWQGNYGSFQTDAGSPGFLPRVFPAKENG